MVNKQLTEQYADLTRDIFSPSYWGGTLRNLDTILQTRGGGQGLRIYDELERDSMAFAVLQKRKMAVIARPWKIEAASTSLRDRKAAEFVEGVLGALNFDKVCFDLLDSLLKGYAVSEIVWEMRDGYLIPAQIIPRAQRRFVFDTDFKPRLLTTTDMLRGEELPERKFIVHSTGGKDGSPYGLGLGHQLFYPVLFKRQSTVFWMAFAERHGEPVVVGKYPSMGLPDYDRNKFQQALERIGQETALTMQTDMIVELLESKSGNITAYEPLLKMLDEQIATIVLGETMSTQSKGAGLGSGQAEVHNSVRLELSQADADLLSGTLNDTLIKWLVELNLPNAQPPRVWRDFSTGEDLKARAERDQIVATMSGLRPTAKYIQETYGGEWEAATVTPDTTASAPPDTQAAATARLSASTPQFTADQQAIEDRTDAALQGLSLGVSNDAIKAAIKAAKSPDDLAERLAILLRDSDAAQFEHTLSRALFAADVMGYAHAQG